MGRRGGAETLSVVLLAFLERRTWRQAELVRRASVERKTLVRLLTDLQRAGLPLSREDDPPQVYWSVPNTWFPGAVAFQGQAVVELVGLLQSMPPSEKRDRVLLQLTKSTPSGQSMLHHDGKLTPTLSIEQDDSLSVLQASVGQSSDLDIRDHVEQRVDGNHRVGAPLRCAFRVRLPDARGLHGQLPLPWTAVERGGVIAFTALTAGLLPLARLIVGLGGAATVDTPELRLVVAGLAQAALEANRQDEPFRLGGEHQDNTERPSGARNMSGE